MYDINLSIDDAIKLYNSGNYKISISIFKKFINTNNMNNINNIHTIQPSPITIIPINNDNISSNDNTSSNDNNTSTNISSTNNNIIIMYLLAMCDYDSINTINTLNINISDTDPNSINNYMKNQLSNDNYVANIVYALWNININPLNINQTFPSSLNMLFSNGLKSLEIGINSLKLIANKSSHSCYLLAHYYLGTMIDLSTGNNYILKSAKLDHFQAQNELRNIGVNWSDQDQFADHIICWFLFPEFIKNSSCIDKLHSFIGCGKIPDGSGWIQCNCCLCGLKTELNCSSIAQYCTDGFLDILKILEHPIKLVTTLSAIATTGLSSVQKEPYTTYGLWSSYLTVGLTSLSLFIKQEQTQTNNSKEE